MNNMPTLVEIALIILLVFVTSIVSFKGGIKYGYICRIIWDLSEEYNIELGKLAPYIFSIMTGCKFKRLNKEE